MSESEIEAMEAASQAFVVQMSGHDKACIIKFSEEVEVVQPFTSDKKLLLNSIKKGDSSKNMGTDPTQRDGTALYDSIYIAIEQLCSGKRENSIKSIVVLTDGEDSSSDYSMETLIQFASDQNVSIYPIGLGSEVYSDILSQIAASTGGSYYPVADSMSDLNQDSNGLAGIYQSISETLKSYYVISYMTTQEEDTTLKVNVRYGDLTASDTVSLTNEGNLEIFI